MVHKRVRLLYFRIQIIKIKRGLNNGIICGYYALRKMLAQVGSINDKKNKYLLNFGQMLKALNSYFIPCKLKTTQKVKDNKPYNISIFTLLQIKNTSSEISTV